MKISVLGAESTGKTELTRALAAHFEAAGRSVTSVPEVLREWCEAYGIILQFIQPGKPNQNAYIERFNRSFREEILNAWVCTSLDEVRALSEEWRVMYNTERPHQSLGDAPPSIFLPRITNPEMSHYELCA